MPERWPLIPLAFTDARPCIHKTYLTGAPFAELLWQKFLFWAEVSAAWSRLNG